MENKLNARKKSSGKVHLITLLYKKMTKKRDRKLKISSSAAQLLRTISMHHLECNDYVLPDETTLQSDYSPAKLNLHETHFSANREKPPRYSEVTAGIEELGRKVNPLSGNSESSHSIPNATEDTLQPKRGIKEDSSNTVLNRLKDFGRRIKNAIKEKRKEHRRIALDGVLDKIPFGIKLAEDAEKEKESPAKKSPKKSFGSEGIVYTNRNFIDNSIQRSHSLAESLDRYSHLIESISVREPPKLSGRLNAAKKQDDFEWRRILHSRSLVESFDQYSRFLEFIPVKELKRNPERLKSIREMDLLLDKGPLKTFGRVLSNPEIRSYSFRSNVKKEMLRICPPLEKLGSSLSVSNKAAYMNSSGESKSANVLVNTVEKMESDTFIVENVESNTSGRLVYLNHTELVEEHDKSEAFVVLDDLTADGSSTNHQHEDQNEIKKDQGGKCIKPSPVSVLDSSLEEVPQSPTKYTVMQGEELNSAPKLENRFTDGSCKIVELVVADSDEEEMITDTVNITSSHHKEEEAELGYVRDILNKSGFDGEEDFLAAWQSSYEPVDQLISLEGEVSPHETMSERIFKDQQLLINLVNEVLLEIYESSIARSTGLSRFCPRVRPMPTGDHVLEEVWAKIRLHCSTQQHISQKVEDIMARDFAKDDGWTNPQLYIEGVGIELEGLIFGNLVEEIILDF